MTSLARHLDQPRDKTPAGRAGSPLSGILPALSLELPHLFLPDLRARRNGDDCDIVVVEPLAGASVAPAVMTEWGRPKLLIKGFQKHGRGRIISAADAYRSTNYDSLGRIASAHSLAKPEAPQISNLGGPYLNHARPHPAQAIGSCPLTGFGAPEKGADTKGEELSAGPLRDRM